MVGKLVGVCQTSYEVHVLHLIVTSDIEPLGLDILLPFGLELMVDLQHFLANLSLEERLVDGCLFVLLH